ncbi:hypothetical protein SAMN02982927_01396 [Sporolactobacillus nakayamae]|uniref:Uncharacterized protein n=1 Tax=Sporolactobacillus nakayamae TaxID=269670 RepID=A0A1I2QXC6_9BACL|nr:hypothetical protein SAMN02982927_01396 [Sporolactobacillus nakayamae]
MCHKKKSLTTTIRTVIMYISWLFLVAWCVTYLALWLSSKNSVYILTGMIGACGILFQIYLIKRTKAQDESVKNKD